MKDLVAIIKNGFESNEIKVEYADVFEEFLEETGELEIFYGDISYCIYVYPACLFYGINWFFAFGKRVPEPRKGRD